MELILVRHAEPVRVAPGEGEGPVDPPLTAQGKRQADAVARWLGDEHIDRIVASPLRRALETAQPLADSSGLTVDIDDAVSEYDRHADHYIPVEELRESKDERWVAMVEGRWQDYGGDDPEAFRRRVVATLDGIARSHPGERIAVFGHGGVINVYTADVLGIDRLLWVDVAYTSITRVAASRNGARSLLTLNETGHLRDLDGRHP